MRVAATDASERTELVQDVHDRHLLAAQLLARVPDHQVLEVDLTVDLEGLSNSACGTYSYAEISSLLLDLEPWRSGSLGGNAMHTLTRWEHPFESWGKHRGAR